MLQIHSVGLPCIVVGTGFQLYGFSGGLYLMACHLSAVGAGDGNETSGLVFHVVPAQLVAHLGIVNRVLLRAQAAAIQQQLHLVGISEDHDSTFVAHLSVPMVAHALVARLYAVPHDVALAVDDANVHYGLVGFEETAHVVGLGLGIEGDVKYTLAPTFCRPALTLAQIVDGTPIGEAHHFVTIHLEEVRTHRGYRGLALVEGHPGEAAPIAGEIHVAVVVGLEIGNLRQFAG